MSGNPLYPASRLDGNQVLTHAFDEDRQRLRVDADATIVNADIDVALDATEDNVAIGDADTGDTLTVNSDGTITTRIVDETGTPFTDANYVPVGQSTHDNLNANANVQQGDIDVSVVNPLFTQTTNGSLEATQQDVLTELQSANSSLDAIESDTDLIRIAVQSIDSDFDVALSTRASEVTQLANNSELQDINTELDTITVELQSSNTSLDAIEADIDLIRIATQSIDSDIDVTLSSRASEATQLANNSELIDVNTELDSITAQLVLANSSLDAIESDSDAIRIAVQSIDTDFDVALSTRASEVTQLANNTELIAANVSLDAIESDADAIRIAVQSIDTDFDVALSTRASEVTQLANNTELQGINTELNTITSQLGLANASLDDIELRLETFDTNAGATGANTLRTASNIYGTDGTTVRQVLTDTSGRVKVQLVGNDGLYTAYVDSSGRVSVNANVTFPEAAYESRFLLNLVGGTRNINVNGTLGAPITFRYAPAGGEIRYAELLSIVYSDNGGLYDPTLFGSVAALANGIQVTIKSKGTVVAYSLIKNNADFQAHFNENFFYYERSPLANIALFVNGSSKFQQRITLDGDLGDYVELKVQDNLTGLTSGVSSTRIWRLLG